MGFRIQYLKSRIDWLECISSLVIEQITLFVGEVRSAHRHAQSVYDAALLEYNNGICESLSTALKPHKCRFILKTFLFGVNLSLSSISTNDGSVTYDPSKKAEVFCTFFKINKVIRNSIFLQFVFQNLNSLNLLLNRLR